MPKGALQVQRIDGLAPTPRRDLVDDQLLEEIELLVDVIARVAGHADYLSRDEVDSVLGLPGDAGGTFRVPEDPYAVTLHPVDRRAGSAIGGRCH